MKRKEILPTYWAPVVASAFVLVLSGLLKLLEPGDAIVAAGIVLVVVAAVAVGHAYVASRAEQSSRREVFALLAHLLPARAESGGDLLRLEDLLAIESAASEVWVYAYDLAWEDEESPLPGLVRMNLERRTRYRYIVPSNSRVLLRVQSLQRKYDDVPDVRKLIGYKKRASDEKLKLVQFGIVIYNPSIFSRELPLDQSIAVFFPHYASYGPKGGRVFISLRGKETIEPQEGFAELWDESETIDWDTAQSQIS